MSDQVQQAGEAFVKVHWTLLDTRDGGHNCVSVGPTTELIQCSLGVPRLHAPKIYSRSSSCSGLRRD